MFVLKSGERVQQLVNVFVKNADRCSGIQPKIMESNLSVMRGNLLLSSADQEIRRLQLVALKKWIETTGHIDEATMNEILSEVAFIVCEQRTKAAKCAAPAGNIALYNRPELTQTEMLKWKLSSKNVEIDRPVSNPLLQPNGKTLTVDVHHILRCSNKILQTGLTTRKTRNEARTAAAHPSRMKPTTDLSTVKNTDWPNSFRLKYHGIE